MNAVPFETIYAEVIRKLHSLDENLTYHCEAHTLDVLTACEEIATREGLTDKHSLFLLKTAAMYHDAGFLEAYSKHEDYSCHIFLQDADTFGFSEKDKSIITGLIDATRLPQKPANLLQKIICDADLDYLGRNDFPEISDALRKEFLHYKVVATNEDWYALQLHFLNNHRYFTKSSVELREPVKQKNIQALLK